MENKMFIPIFEKDGHRLFIKLESFTADTPQEAERIGWGAALVEGVIMGFAFKGETLEIHEGQHPHVESDMGSMLVAILSGPMFDRVMADHPLPDVVG